MTSYYDIHSIKEGLNACLDMIPASMFRLASVFSASINKLDEPMQLAIIGKISSSKSTLVNALLGKDELMSTGQKEVTYNVGWLKYGKPESDIILHYKDGASPCTKKYSEFAKLSIESHEEELDRISYIETFDDSDILKEVNIIDTPGLDALRGKDSQNTLDFISKVRPDAVIMLFTHSVAENTLDVVRRFNAGSNFSPLNAIGVLSKIDVLWQETIPREKSALQIGQRVVGNKMCKDEMLRKTLFNLYPISALLFLASTTLEERDLQDIKRAYAEVPDVFRKSLNSMPKFMGEEGLPLSSTRKKELADRMGLYGLWLIAQSIKNDEDLSLEEVKKLFFRESGAEAFVRIIHNHFGSRAKIIKLESIYQHIQQTIQMVRAQAKDMTSRSMLSAIEQKVSDIFSSLVHEHNEYEMLNRVYAGELWLEDDVKDEFCRLCGERGNSAPERLGLSVGTDSHTLLNKTMEREKYWRREIAQTPDTDEKVWMNVILKSYGLLRQKIQTYQYQYTQANAFLFNQ